MRSVVDARLVLEAQHFALRFACDDCVHFAAEREPGRSCGNGWPIRLRRGEIASPPLLPDAPLDAIADVAFCKEFELA